jgi:DNA repair protein RadD
MRLMQILNHFVASLALAGGLRDMATLRKYQQDAVDCAIDWCKRSIEPAVLDLATGAGKSHIIAAIAAELHRVSGGKHVLCLAPSAELVTQNREKYLATGNPASLYSASAGGKCLRHPVVFGTPGTVKSAARRIGSRFCAVIIDEAHGITPTVRGIINAMREQNDKLRVIGLSATPYRLNTGYIYAIDDKDRAVHDCKDPYFAKLLYRVPARYLIDNGYLTQPIVSDIGGDHYSTLHMELNSRGQFDAKDVDRAFIGKGRKTAAIVADIIERCKERKGVMIFAATIQHAQEIMESLPPVLSAIVTGDTNKNQRASIINRFKRHELKYLVNVSVLTTGFDAPHVDAIAIMRATESVGLLQQIIGRGLRICDGKQNCIVLDYAENVERHCPDGDVFNPQIKVRGGKTEESEQIEVNCPECGTTNIVNVRPNPDQFKISKDGYFVDLAGNKSGIPAHFARRCAGLLPIGRGELRQCEYRWMGKECPKCLHHNDIAARYCEQCKAELVDPNEKLRVDFKRYKKDPTNLQTDRVLDWSVQETLSRAGNPCLAVTYDTEWRKFTVWYNDKMKSRWNKFVNSTDSGKKMPETVTYKKNPESGFFEIYDYGRPHDEISAVA